MLYLILKDLTKRGEAIPQVLRQHAPTELQTKERLSFKAAEYNHKNGNKQKMLNNLENLTQLDDKINFLKRKDYFHEAAVLLQDEGWYHTLYSNN